jgi:hypothetical protein
MSVRTHPQLTAKALLRWKSYYSQVIHRSLFPNPAFHLGVHFRRTVYIHIVSCLLSSSAKAGLTEMMSVLRSYTMKSSLTHESVLQRGDDDNSDLMLKRFWNYSFLDFLSSIRERERVACV